MKERERVGSNLPALLCQMSLLISLTTVFFNILLYVRCVSEIVACPIALLTTSILTPLFRAMNPNVILPQ